MINSGSATSRIAVRRATALAAALAFALGVSAGRAQTTRAPAEFELSRSVQQTLARTQELWLQWVTATLQDNRARSEEALRGLSVAAREIGFAHFPDLALGALAQARQSAAAGDFARARLQISAAELLDPRRPETLFAEAAVARAEGRWLAAVGGQLRGIGRSLAGPDGDQLFSSIGLWFLLVLLVATTIFVGLLLGHFAVEVIRLLHGSLSPPVPGWAAAGIVIFVICAPLALPHGFYWWLMLVSALVWAFASRSQRVIIAIGWLLSAATPLVTDQMQQRLALAHTPPMRAFNALVESRIYGGFFSDIQVLRSALPDEPAAVEMVADVHRTLGQWDVARPLYRRILFDEPDNVPVLLNLGAYYFRKGDHAVANAYFERATRNQQPSAAAWYNLSQGYSDAYLFDESRDALGRAREIDGSAVDVWIATSNPDRVLTFNGSLARRSEIEAGLESAWRGDTRGAEGGAMEPIRILGAPLAALLIGLGVRALRHRNTPAGAARRRPGRRGRIVRWIRQLLPMIEATERGEGWRAWSHLLLLTSLFLAPKLFGLLGDPWFAGWPEPTGLAWICGLGLLLYFGYRLRHGWVLSED